MIPPTIRIGAETMIVRPMKTTVWTCWTSFVLRVISDAGPNWLTSTCENVSTLVKIGRAHVAPEAHRDPRAASRPRGSTATPRSAVTTSISPPTRRM